MPERTVLIIDDDQTLVAALKEGLETIGFKVSTAYDGLQGILQAHSARPQVIMLDFNMPAGGGSGVYERLRGSSDTAKIPIVFLTGATVEEVKGKIRSTPNTYFLRKPVSVAQMRKVLDKILGATPGGPATEPAAAPPAPFAGPQTAGQEAPFAGLVMPAQSTPMPGAPPAPMPGVNRGGPPTGFPSPPSASPAPAQGFPSPQQASSRQAPSGPPPAPGLPSGGRGAPSQAAPAPATQQPLSLRPAQGGAKRHEFEVRVSLADADRLGIIYYANYLRYFEIGRTELFRILGIRYRDLEMERHIFLPVVESRVEYLAPSRYDDLLLIRTWLSWLGPASLCFQNEIYDREAQNRLVARGFTRHAVLNEYWKPTRLPPDLKSLLASCVAPA